MEPFNNNIICLCLYLYWLIFNKGIFFIKRFITLRITKLAEILLYLNFI